MHTISLTKFKGGVAGTETAAQLATLYALAGWRVLVLDTDPQGGITKRFFPKVGDDTLPTLANAINAYIADRKSPAVRLIQCVRIAYVRRDARKKEFSQIAVVPANRALQDEESNIGNMPVGRTKVLKRMLATVASHYDICLIDTPPVFGYLSRNAVVAANGLLLPMLPEPPSFNSLAELRSELDMMAEEDEIPAIVGVVANRFSVKSTRHEIGETLLKVAAGILPPDRLADYGAGVSEFNADSLQGFNAPYLGNVPNDNRAGDGSRLRKSYEPIAMELAIKIGLGVPDFTEAHNATISA